MTLAKPKPFQAATIAAALRTLSDPDGPRRFLVADEPGLGKTLVAREIIAGLLGKKRSFVIFYICNSRAISRQNGERLVESLRRPKEALAQQDRLALLDTPLGLTASRRLQLAAEASGVLGLLLRRPKRLNEDLVDEPTAARTRWKITAMPSAAPLPWSPATPGLARAVWQLDLLRCRGGEPRTFFVEAPDATGRLGLPADAADRSTAEGAEGRRAANG